MLIRFKPNKTLLPFDSIIFILSVIQITLFFVSSIIPNSTILYIAVFALNVLLMVYQSPVVRLHFHPVIILFSLFVLFCFLSCKWAISPSQAKRMSMSLLKMLAVSVVYYWYFRKFDSIEPFLKVMMWADFLIIIVSIFYYGLSFFATLLSSNIRLSNDFLNSNEIGRLCCQAILIYFFILKKHGLHSIKTNISNLFGLIFGTLSMFIIIVSQSRTAMVSLFFGIIITYYFYEKNNAKDSFKRIKLFLSIVFIACVFLILLQLPAFDGFRNRMSGLFNGIGGGKSDESTEIRLKMVKFGLKTFKKNFWVGIGIDNAKEVNPYLPGYLHNNYVELLADTGIIGFLLYYSMFVFLLYKSLRRKNKDPYDAVVIALLCCSLINDFGGVTYYLRELPFMIMMFCVNDDIKNRRLLVQ